METEIYNWFCNTHHIKVPNEWLSACLTWLQDEEHKARHEFGPLAYEQWLIANLREIGAKCLVPNLSLVKSTILKGYFALQIDSIQDISKPSYQQLLKLEGKNNINSEVSADNDWKAEKFQDKNRMLKLTLTDGDQEIFGLEYQAIPNLNLNLPPGTKVLIFGEILCRKGTLLLKKDNVKVLGGEVAELAETANSLILMQNKLNLLKSLDSARRDVPFALNNAATDLEQADSINNENQENQRPRNYAPPLNRIQPCNSAASNSNATDDIWSDDDDEIFNFVQPSIVNSGANSQSSSRDFEANLLRGDETPRSSIYITSQLNITNKDNLSGHYDDFSLDSDEEFESLLNSAKNLRQQSQKPTVVVTPQMEISNKNVKIFEDPALSSDNSDEEFEKLLFSAKCDKNVTATPPFIYIDTLPSLPSVYYFKTVIKGFVITFLSALRTANQSLSMEVLINDGTGSIKAVLSNEVIFSLIGMTFKEFETLKKASKLNLEAQNTMAKVLAQFRRKVIDLSCLFEIEAEPQSTSVTVINLVEVSRNVVDYFEKV